MPNPRIEPNTAPTPEQLAEALSNLIQWCEEPIRDIGTIHPVFGHARELLARYYSSSSKAGIDPASE